MKKILTPSLLLCIIFMLTAQTLFANTNKPYLETSYNAPQNYAQSLTIYLNPNQQKCEELYGNNWYSICNPSVGEVGKTLDTIKMNPHKKGYWEWSGTSSIRFTPDSKDRWEPSTKVKIELPLDIFPKSAEISGRSITFTTLPQAGEIESYKVWIDPSKNNKHALSYAINFLYPIKDTKALEKNISVSAKDKQSGLQLAKPSFTWSRNNSYVNVTVPIVELSETKTIAEIVVNGMKTYYNEYGEIKFANTNLSATLELKGKQELFYPENYTITTEYDKNLKQYYLVTLDTSLQVSTDDLKKRISFYSLPKKITEESRIPFDWSQANSLDLGPKYEFELITPSQRASNTHSFKVYAEPETYIAIHIDNDLKSTAGYPFNYPYSKVLYADSYTPKVSFLQPGNILNLEGSRKLEIQTNQITEVKWEAQKIRIPYLSVLTEDFFNLASNGAREYNEYDYYDDYNNYGNSSSSSYESISEIVSGTIKVDGTASADSKIIDFDITPLLEDNKNGDTSGIIKLSLIGMQGDKEVSSDEKMLVVTDIGLIVKEDAKGQREVFTYSMSKGAPLSNIEVEILGANGLPLVKGVSNNDGLATLGNIDNFKRDKRPVVLVASNKDKNDVTFISMDNLAKNIETSRFSVQGRLSSNEGLQAYVFAERGIFRPGDMLNFSAMIRNADNSLPPSLPLQAILFDSEGIKVFEENYNLSEKDFGMHTFSWKSNESSPTGRYRLEIMSNNEYIGSSVVRVEEFKPENLVVEAEITPKKTRGWYVLDKNSEIELNVALENLYGGGAQNRKVEADLTITRAQLSFNGYEDYVFSDPYSFEYQYNSIDLPQMITNDEGKASSKININSYIKSAGTYDATFYIEGFEPNGGRAVSTNAKALFSTADKVVGYKTTGEILDLNYIPQDRKGKLAFITLDSDLKQVNNTSYTFVLSKRNYVRNLVSNNIQEFSYQDTLVQEEVSSEKVENKSGVILWNIPTDKVGEYILTIYASNDTKKSLPLSRVPFNIIGNELRVDPQTIPSTLKIALPTENYNSGDSLKVSLSLPYDGFGLITLEADNILSHTWFKGKAGQSLQSIEIPSDYEGRAYVSVSYLKDMESKDYYMEPLSYSVEPILVNISKRKISLALEANEMYKSGDTVKVKLTSNQPSKAILFAVDEGILALTDYSTPSPIRYFLEDKALEVTTSQLSNLMMPEMDLANGMMMKMEASAFGGDMARNSARYTNPFKRKAEPPLVYWSGIIDVDSSGKEVEFTIPTYYNGNVRIMAVAVNENSFGSVHKNSYVRSDLVITPQIPVMASPKDILETSVAIANTTDKEKTFDIEYQLSSGLKLTSSTAKTITLKANEEKVIPLTFVVQPVLGEASVNFILKNADEEYTRQSTLSVRPSTPYITTIDVGTTRQEIDIRQGRELFPYEVVHELSASYTPVPFVQAIVGFLENYPYDCTEQLISRAMPYVVLNGETEILFGNKKDPKKAEEDARKIINEAIYAIRSSTYYGSGVSLWKDSSKTDDVLTIYAGDFFLSMRKSGLMPPRDIEDMVFDAIRNIASRKPLTLEQARTSAYAIWVLTRGGSVTTQLIENLQTNLDSSSANDMMNWKKDITATFIASVYKMLLIDGAHEIIDQNKLDFKTFQSSSFFDALAAQSLYTRILIESFPEMLSSAQHENFTSQILTSFNSGHSTFSASQALVALWQIGMGNEQEINQNLISCSDSNPNNQGKILNLGSSTVGISSPLCEKFSIHAGNGSTIYYQLLTSGYDVNPPSKKVAQGLEVTKTLIDKEGQPITKINIGDVLTVQIKAKAHGKNLQNIVIQDLLSGAFELVLEDTELMQVSYLLDSKNMREDRALFFTSLDTTDNVYSYRVRAINKGTFVLPAVYASSMYDTKLQANSLSQTIVVE